MMSAELQARVADVCVLFVFFGALFMIARMTCKVLWYKRYGIVLIACAALGVLHSHLTSEPTAKTWFHLMLYGNTLYFGGEFVNGVWRCIKNEIRKRVYKLPPKGHYNDEEKL